MDLSSIIVDPATLGPSNDADRAAEKRKRESRKNHFESQAAERLDAILDRQLVVEDGVWDEPVDGAAAHPAESSQPGFSLTAAAAKAAAASGPAAPKRALSPAAKKHKKKKKKHKKHKKKKSSKS